MEYSREKRSVTEFVFSKLQVYGLQLKEYGTTLQMHSLKLSETLGQEEGGQMFLFLG